VSDDNTPLSNTKIKANELQVKTTGRGHVVPDQTICFQARLGSPLIGDMPVASITPGTYDIIRIRGGVVTTIVDDAAWLAINGEVYFLYNFPSASWQNSDAYQIMPNGDTQATIGGNTYSAVIPCWAGMVFDTDEVVEEIEEIEHHLHNLSFRFPDDVTDSRTITSDIVGPNPDTFGVWVRVATAAELTAAWGAAKTHFDPNKLMVINGTNGRLFGVQIGYGDGTLVGTKVIANDTFNTTGGLTNRNSPINVSPAIRQAIDGSDLWVRCKDDVGGGSFETFVEAHPYPHET
jgi:hypothetical protein